jgi:hypothetical protein
MTDRSIFIAVPCYSGQIECTTANSLMRARDEVTVLGWPCTVEFRPLDSLLPRARNVMLTDFVKSGMTDLVFWDADISVPPGAFSQLLSHDVEFVAGAYRWRKDPEGYAIQSPAPLSLDDIRPSGLIEVHGTPAGFMRITRAAVDRMTAHFPDLYVDDRELGRLIWLFDQEYRDHQYYSEDFLFCRRFREAGGTVWVDPNLAIFHTGSKTFFGRYSDYLARKGVTPQRLDDARARLRARIAEIDPGAWPPDEVVKLEAAVLAAE